MADSATEQAATEKTSTSSSASSSASKKSAAKKTAKKSASKKSPAKKTTAKRSAAKKTGATKKSAAKKAPPKKAAAKTTAAPRKTATKTPSAVERVTGTVRGTTTSVAETGRAVVAKAAAVAQKPVEAGQVIVGKTGGRVVDVGRTVLAPPAQLMAAARTRAKEMVGDPVALRGLADRALRSKSGRSGPLGEVSDEFKTLGRLVAAYARGDYRDIPLDSLLTVIAGLVYVASPLDLLPESVPVAGYADDVVAVGVVVRQVHHELAAFREWEARQQ